MDEFNKFLSLAFERKLCDKDGSSPELVGKP